MTHTGRIHEYTEKPTIKEADRRFIYELVEDARAPLTTLGKKLRISKDTAHYTLSKLQEKNVITHISPVVDLKAFDYYTFHAFFVTNDEKTGRKNAFIEHLISHPHTKSVMEYSSRWEVEWTCVAHSVREFDNLLTEVTTLFSDVVTEKTKCALIRGYKSTTVAFRRPKLMKKKVSYSPDDVDKKILSCLHTDGRMSTYEIGALIDLSANAVRYRIKKMLDAHIIRSFTGTVNLNALDYHLYTVGIVLKSLDSQQELKLKEFLRSQRFIIRAVKILGPWDVLLTIVSDNIKHFHETVKQIEDNFAHIILSYDSLIGYEEKVFKYIPDVVLGDNLVDLKKSPKKKTSKKAKK